MVSLIKESLTYIWYNSTLFKSATTYFDSQTTTNQEILPRPIGQKFSLTLLPPRSEDVCKKIMDDFITINPIFPMS